MSTKTGVSYLHHCGQGLNSVLLNKSTKVYIMKIVLAVIITIIITGFVSATESCTDLAGTLYDIQHKNSTQPYNHRDTVIMHNCRGEHDYR